MTRNPAFFKRGLIPLIIPMMAALVILLGAVVYHFATEQQGSSDMTEEDVRAALSFFETQMLLSNDEEVQSDMGSQALEVLSRYVKQEAAKILVKDHCNATLEDIFKAVSLAEKAIKAGLEKERVLLLEWARLAFRALVPEAALASGHTVMEQGHQVDEFTMGEDGTLRQVVEEANEIYIDRIQLGDLSNLLGLEDLALDIQRGKYIQPACVQLWDVNIDASYDFDNGPIDNGEQWKQKVTIEDLPVYKFDPKLHIPFMSKTFEEVGTFEENKGWYFNGGSSVSCSISGDIIWVIAIEESSHVDLWNYRINLEIYPVLNSNELSSLCTDGVRSPVVASRTFKSAKYEIPMLSFWRRNAFTLERYREIGKEADVAEMSIRFTPTRRVSIKELKEILFND